MKTNITQFFYKKNLLLRGIRKISRSNFQFLSGGQQRKLIKRVQKLYRQLNSNHRFKQLKPAVATALLAAGFTFNSAQAQDFSAAPVSNPFELALDNQIIVLPEAVDMDNDGDLDLLVGGVIDSDYFVDQGFTYYENIGTATEAQFGSGVSNAFGLFGESDLNFFSHGDLDNDGDQDIIASVFYFDSDLSFRYFENIGTAEIPEFAEPVNDPFGIEVVASSLFSNPEITDIDGDGDLDILFQSFDESIGPFIRLIENTGTAEVPEWAEPISTAEIPIVEYSFLILRSGDLDLDGDIDLFIGTAEEDGEYGYYMFYENITEPDGDLTFNQLEINPFGLIPCANYCIPELADMDGDGDLDIISGIYNGSTFTENIDGINIAPTSENQTVEATEDSVYNFSSADFPFFDSNAADDLTAILITSVPSNGLLKLGETEVAENFEIEANDIDDLSYLPNENLSGEALDSFTFKVGDGELFSEEESTITVNVLAVNDSPSFTLESDTLCPNWQSLTSNLLDISDVDGDDLSFTTLTDDPQLEEASVAYNAGENTAVVDFTPAWNAEGIVAIPIEMSDGTETVTKTIYVDFDCVTGVGIDDFVSEKSISLYPNPASNFVSIEWEEAANQNTRIEVYDLQSKKLMDQRLTPGILQRLNVAELASGSYLIKWTAGDKVGLKQLVVK